jgi:hypothetical protein
MCMPNIVVIPDQNSREPVQVQIPDQTQQPIQFTTASLIALMLMAIVALFVFFSTRPVTSTTNSGLTNTGGVINTTAPQVNTQPTSDPLETE